MDQKELNRRLALHKKWMNNEEGGQQLNLRNADLEDADLWGVNLRDGTKPIYMVSNTGDAEALIVPVRAKKTK